MCRFQCLHHQPVFQKKQLFYQRWLIVSGGSRKFWWGGFEAQNLKNSDVFTEIESDFSAEIGRFFRPNSGDLQKKKKVFTKIQSDFSAEIGNSNVFFAQIQVVSQKKKKKRSSPKLRLIFRRIRYV